MNERISKFPFKGSTHSNFISFENRSGIPHAVNNVISSIEKLEEAIKRAVRAYEVEVRKDAYQSWGDLANTINVVFNPKTMSVDIYSDHPDANLLENGTPDTPPRPAIRTAAIKASSELVPMIRDTFKKLGFSDV